MTRFFLFVILAAALVGAGPAQAQTAPSLTSQQPPVRVIVEPAYQQASDEAQTLSQWSTRIAAIVPVTDGLQLHLRSMAAASAGKDMSSVQGLDDVELGALYARPIGLGSLVGSIDVDLPTGKRELSPSELETTIAMSQNVYDFRVPSLGQGLGVNPSLTWAVPLGDDVMAGVGVAYHYHGAYRPFSQMDGDYDPGDEVEVFVGADVRIARVHAVSGDISFTRFGIDTIGGERRYDPGYRLSGTLQYLYQQGFTTVRVLGKYQDWAESRIFVTGLGAGAPDVTSGGKVVPSEWLARVRVGILASERVRLQFRLDGHRYEETLLNDELLVGSAGLGTTFRLSDQFYLTPSAGYTMGDVTGFEGSLRTEFRF